MYAPVTTSLWRAWGRANLSALLAGVLVATIGVLALGDFKPEAIPQAAIVVGYLPGLMLFGVGLGLFQQSVLRHLTRSARWWALATGLGYALGGFLLALSQAVTDSTHWFGQAGAFGTGLGLAQWFVLKRWDVCPRWWPLQSTLAFIVLTAAMRVVVAGVYENWGGSPIDFVLGAPIITGLALVPLLKRLQGMRGMPSAPP